MKILLLLTPLFLLVGFWLALQAKRRSQLIREFSARLGLVYRSQDDGRLEQTLNRSFALNAPLGRNLSNIKDIAEGDGILLFRATEALDLSHYGLPQNSHFGRLAVYFHTPATSEFYFLAQGTDHFKPIVPQQANELVDNRGFAGIRQLIRTNPPPHMLSITLLRGGFLAYLEPPVTGGEKFDDLDYLFTFAQRCRRALRTVSRDG